MSFPWATNTSKFHSCETTQTARSGDAVFVKFLLECFFSVSVYLNTLSVPCFLDGDFWGVFWCFFLSFFWGYLCYLKPTKKHGTFGGLGSEWIVANSWSTRCSEKTTHRRSVPICPTVKMIAHTIFQVMLDKRCLILSKCNELHRLCMQELPSAMHSTCELSPWSCWTKCCKEHLDLILRKTWGTSFPPLKSNKNPKITNIQKKMEKWSKTTKKVFFKKWRKKNKC